MLRLVFSTCVDVRCTVLPAVQLSVDFYFREAPPFRHQILDCSQRMSVNVRMSLSLCGLVSAGGC